MAQVPFVEVSHLPSSVSFYSAVLQPLGLKYIGSTRASPPSVTFGTESGPVLRVCQPYGIPKISQLVFVASSESAVLRFHERGLQANPSLRLRILDQEQAGARRLGLLEGRAVVRAALLDLDGNRIEVLSSEAPPPPETMNGNDYVPDPTRPRPGEVSSILEWNFDGNSQAASPASHPSPFRSNDHPEPRGAGADGSRQFHRRGTASPPSKSSAPLPSSGGVNASTIVGALLGVAAGAALTYSMVSRSDDAADSRKRVEDRRALPRNTFAERPGYGQDNPMMTATRKIGFARPEIHGVSASTQSCDHSHKPSPRDQRSRRYLVQGVEAAADSSRLDGKYDASNVPFHTRTRYDVRSSYPRRAAGSRSRSEAPPERVRLSVDELGEQEGLHAPLPYRGAVTRSVHAPANARSARASYDTSAQTRRLSAAEVLDQVHSRASRPVSEQHERTRRGRASSLVFAHRSPVAPKTPGASKAPSHVSATRAAPPASATHSYTSARRVPLPTSRAPSYVSAREMPLPASRAPSYVSARNMPLPASDGGSSEADWNDDIDSVAPSDSISCVGSKTGRDRRSRRQRQR